MMSNFPTREEVQALRDKYPKGTRIKLLEFGDPNDKAPLENGIAGEVGFIDDIGQIHVNWDPSPEERRLAKAEGREPHGRTLPVSAEYGDVFIKI